MPPALISQALVALDSVLGITEELRAESAEALGPKQRALAARAAGGGIGGTWHFVLSV